MLLNNLFNFRACVFLYFYNVYLIKLLVNPQMFFMVQTWFLKFLSFLIPQDNNINVRAETKQTS